MDFGKLTDSKSRCEFFLGVAAGSNDDKAIAAYSQVAALFAVAAAIEKLDPVRMEAQAHRGAAGSPDQLLGGRYG